MGLDGVFGLRHFLELSFLAMGAMSREDIEVELLVDLREFTPGSLGEQVVSHVREHSEVAGRMFSESGHDLWGHEIGLTSLSKNVLEPVEQITWGEVIQRKPGTDTAGDGQQFGAAKAICQPAVPAEDDGENGA